MIDEVVHLTNDAEPPSTAQSDSSASWRVLVVDDDPEVHSITRFVLSNQRILGRPLQLLHAHSAQQARVRLSEYDDIAVALIDVVMETERAGLDLVRYVREERGLMECRLILRTGQPGYAPELTVIQQYDINDYRTKAELTHSRLISTVSTAVRAYHQLRTIAEHRRGLELIARANVDLMAQRSIVSLANVALNQLGALLHLPPDGLFCTDLGSPQDTGFRQYRLVGATGRFAHYLGCSIETLPDREIVSLLRDGMSQGQHLIGPDYHLLYLVGADRRDAVIYLYCKQGLSIAERSLLEPFVANITACLRNVTLVESLLTARQEIDRQRSFLRAVIDADPHFIYVQDRDNRIRLVNRSLAARFGLEPEQMVGHAFSELIGDTGPVPTFLKDDAAVLAETQGTTELEATFVDHLGEARWFHTIKAPIKNERGEVEQLLGVSIETTERKRAEQRLFEAKERAQVTLHCIGDAVITTDANALIDYLNPVAESLTGWTPEEARGQPVSEVFRIVDELTHKPAPDPVNRCLKEGKVVGLKNRTMLIGRGSQTYHIDDTAAPIRDRDGRVLGAVLVFHDVTETRQLTRQLHYDATHDALTGLLNRVEFERRLHEALASSREDNTRHALCYLDLDQFKIVNDTAGHTAGDELLRQINRLLAGMFRERDTLARIGGDEFGLLLENCPMDRAQTIAQSVVNAIRDYRFQWESRSYQIGVSIGLVSITAEVKDTAQLLTQADIACYAAKEMGRSRIHVYHSEDVETTQRHREILGAAGLRDALEEGRFRLHYQPIVSLSGSDDRTVRYEALLRVAPSGTLGDDEPMLPAAFIPAAERYGLMGAIDRWVIRTAFREFENGIGKTGAMIAINLSGNSLNDEGLLPFVETQLAEHRFPPERVCFEITETAAIQNLRSVIALMKALKAMGSLFALDDFGSGMSSFHYLQTLPIDYLKIDGSFVKNMNENASDCALVAAINKMSDTLGIRTVAEYAHSREVVERLRELGVDYAQGYYFGKPRPHELITENLP